MTDRTFRSSVRPVAVRAGIAACVLTFALSGAVLDVRAQSPADWADMSDRVTGVEERLRSLESGPARAVPSPRGNANLPSSTSAELSLRLNTIEGQMRRLTGQLEDLSFRLRRLSDRIKRSSQDNEFRFKELEKRAGRPSSSRRAEVPDQPPGTGLRIRPAPQFKEQPRVVIKPPRVIGPQVEARPIGPTLDTGSATLPPVRIERNSSLKRAAPPTSLGRIPSGMLGPGSRVEPGTDTAALNQPAVDEAGALYERAYDKYLNRQFGTAESSFRGFIRRYPTHELAGQAQYWLGETYYARNNYRQAARSFLIGYRKYPKGRKAPESLLKLGMTLHKLGDKSQACATYDKLTREYPKVSRAVRRTASSERRRAGC